MKIITNEEELRDLIVDCVPNNILDEIKYQKFLEYLNRYFDVISPSLEQTLQSDRVKVAEQFLDEMVKPTSKLDNSAELIKL